MTIFSSLFRRRRHPVNPIQRPDSDSALLARIDQRLAQTDAQQEALGRIERQLARTGAQVDFLNNHTASYLGDGTALTHLVDETPFFINSNDYGSPMNFLSGGRYEEDNLAVLLSFVDDSTVFVDVGANLGFFSLRVAQRLRGGSGKVLAFEPQASVMELMRRTLHLNALTRYVETYPFALSDRAGFTSFDVPIGHLGGGQIRPGVTERWHGALTVPVETREIELRVFDDLVPEDFRCDLVKIDVEGHELSVLRGMRRSLQRSPNAVVLFEKMVRDHGSERAMWNLFGELGMRLYGVGDEAMLIPLASPQALIEWDRGYAFAARDPALLERPGRRRFRMGARQLRIRDGARWHGTGRETLAEIASDGVLSFGPYWSLGRGHWRVRIDGEFNRTIEVIIKERVGTLEIARIRLQPGILTAEFHCDHDLVEFECVLHAIDQQLTELRLAGIDFERADGSVAPPVTGTLAIEVIDLAARETMLRLPELPPPRDEARYTSPRAQPRFTVFSNCQGEVFAAAIQAFMGGRMPSIHAVHQFALDQPKFLVEPLRELARHHDAILTQPGLAVKIEPLLPELAGRIQRFPKLSFPAFHPDCCYVYRSEGEILDGVLGPYQSSIVYQAWRVGMSAGETLDLFRDEVYETLLFHDYWEASAHGLLAEGRAANLPLDGLLERWRMQGCFMHTHNHPKAAVIVDVARATLLRMGYELPAIEPADFLHDALGSGPVWPVYPEIAARLGIAGSYQFKASNGNQDVRTTVRLFDLEQFIERSFEAFATADREVMYCERPFSARYAEVFGDAARKRGRIVVGDRQQASRVHPYQNLPERQSWRSAVGSKSIAEIDPVSPRFQFETQTRIATAGSCFAQNISRALLARRCGYMLSEPSPLGITAADAAARQYGLYSARYGNLYTARQLLQLLRRSTGTFVPAESAWNRPDGHFADPFRPSIEPAGFASVSALETDRASHLAAVRHMFESLEVFIFTLGLTEAWASNIDGAVFPIAPGVIAGTYDAEQHQFVNFEYNEVVSDLETFVDELKAINPVAQVLLTVSPVPLAATYENRHVLTSTAQSKAVLRAAADAVCRSRPQCDYFPSYEIISGHHTHGSYYATDLRGITRSGVDQVMRLFFKHYVPAATAPEPDAELVTEVTHVSRVLCEEEQLDQRTAS